MVKSTFGINLYYKHKNVKMLKNSFQSFRKIFRKTLVMQNMLSMEVFACNLNFFVR